MAQATNELTPMRRQYQQIKDQHKDCILMFRLGDFYEMFDEDAKLTARELDLTLTTRDRGKPKEEQTPMCGVPYHSVDSYIARLVQKGYKVAICEQMEDPATAKGLVQRDITRIITPGTVTESCMLDESKNNYIGCIYGESGKFGLAFCDVSTGAFFTTVCSDAQNVASELGRFAPSEILRYGSNVDCEVIEDAVFRRLSCCVSEGKQELFALESAEALLENHFHATLSQMGIAGMPAAVIASGALLQTLLTLQKNDLAHIRELQYYTTGRFMELDLDARRNLELTETMRSKEKRGTLLWVLDKTHTAMGGRMLRSWLEKPLLDPVEITRRHGAVEELTDNVIVRGELEEALRDVTDLERVQTRIVTGTVNCRDLLGLARGFRALPDVKAQLQKCDSPLLKKLEAAIDPLTDCADRIENTLVDDPPLTIREGGIIRKGASDAIVEYVKGLGGAVPADLQGHTDQVSKQGGTPLTVCVGKRVLGVIYLKDIVKDGLVERFARLRAIGIKTIMCTGDNPLTAATIAKSETAENLIIQIFLTVAGPSTFHLAWIQVTIISCKMLCFRTAFHSSFIIISGRNKMSQYSAAVNAFPLKRIIRHFIKFIPADLCCHEIRNSTFLQNLRKCCGITEYVRKPQDLIVHAELISEKFLSMHKLTHQSFP